MPGLVLTFALTVPGGIPSQSSGGSHAKPLDAEPGRTEYGKHCAGCHESDGRGFETAPPLVGSAWVAGPDSRLVRMVLHGVRGPLAVGGKTYNMEMPGFGAFLSDEEIARVLSFVRRRWGGPSPAVSVETVRRIRAATRNRRNYWTAEELLAEP